MNNHNLAVEQTEAGFKVWATDFTPEGAKERVILDGSLIEVYRSPPICNLSKLRCDFPGRSPCPVSSTWFAMKCVT